MGAQSRKTNVVGSLSTFVGRTAELAAIDECFARAARIVTLLGPPGVGKTRLASRYAETRQEPYAAFGGVWFCELALARDLDTLCRTIAKSLSAPLPEELAGGALTDLVAALLAERGPTLVVCDNFEQMESHAGRALERFCRAAPDLRLLVTSQRRLGIGGESCLEVPPLSAADAMQLFSDRSAHAGATAVPGDEAATAALVGRLDHLPLAIEIAAARSRTSSPAELLARISSQHAALAGAVERSWALLAGAEQEALARCAVFEGEFSLDAAEAVLTTPDVLATLSALRDRSLLVTRRDDADTRFRMYASLRHFARQRLAERGEADAVLRHRRYFIDRGLALAAELWFRGDARVRASLIRLHDDLVSIARSIRSADSPSSEDRSDLARVVFALSPTIGAASGLDSAFALLDAGIEAAHAAGTFDLAGRLLVVRGGAHGVRAEHARALADYEAARALGEQRDDEDLVADALIMTAVRLRQQGEVEAARAMLEDARSRLGPDSAPRVSGACAVVSAFVAGELGRADEARRANLRARRMFDAAGDRWSSALAIANIAQLDQEAGRFDDAERGFDEALATFHDYGDRRYEGRYLGYRAALDHERGRLGDARAKYRRALDLLSGLRMAHVEALWRAALGALEAESGDLRSGAEEIDHARDLLEGVDAPAFRSAVEVYALHLLAPSARTLGSVEHAEQSQDVRLAIRILEQRATASRRPHGNAILTVTEGARAFKIGDESAVDLSRRGALRRVLLHLIETRARAPGVASEWQVLLEHGWPGERVLAEAGATRVRVAVATLRKMGLAGVLMTRDDGYLLERVDVREIVDFNQSDFNEP